jgi:hypothetical protein
VGGVIYLMQACYDLLEHFGVEGDSDLAFHVECAFFLVPVECGGRFLKFLRYALRFKCPPRIRGAAEAYFVAVVLSRGATADTGDCFLGHLAEVFACLETEPLAASETRIGRI